jgi:hypothetical protein
LLAAVAYRYFPVSVGPVHHDVSGVSTPTVGVVAARTYHAETSYDLSMIDADSILAAQPHCVRDFKSMNPQNRPDPFKRYLGAEIVVLPGDFPDTDRPALEVLAGRPAASPTPFDTGALARLLFFTARVLRVTTALRDSVAGS